MTLTAIQKRDAIESADKILSCYGVTLAKADPNILTPRGFDQVVLGVLGEMHGKVRGTEAKAMDAFLEELQWQWGGLSPEQQSEKIRFAASKWLEITEDTAPIVGKVLKEQGEAIVVATKVAADKKFKLRIEPSFNMPDHVAVNHLANSQANFIRTAAGKRMETLSAYARMTVAKGMEAGLDRHEIGKDLEKVLKGSEAERSRGYYQMIASVFVARARSYSSLSSFDEAGITAYQLEAVLDEVTTEMCRFLHGQVFSTAAGLQKFDEAQNAADPEDVKNIQPWVYSARTGNPGEPEQRAMFYKQNGVRSHVAIIDKPGYGKADAVGTYSHAMSSKQLQAAGMSTPPFHGHCRTAMVPVYGQTRARLPEPKPVPPQQPMNVGEPVKPEELGPPAPVKGPLLEELAPGGLEPTFAPEGDNERAGKPAPKTPLQLAMEKLAALPPAVEWSKMYVTPPNILPAPYNPITGKVELPYGSMHHLHAVNALKHPKQVVPIQSLIDSVQKHPMVFTEQVASYMKGADAPDGLVIAKHNGKFYLVGSPTLKIPQASEYLTALHLQGNTTVKAHIVDMDAFLAKPKVPKKPKKPKVIVPPAAPPVAPLPKPAPAPLAKPMPEGDAENILFSQTGTQLGSNTGGFYTGKDGIKRYVKFYDDPEQARCEHLANNIYRDLGLHAPESQLFTKDGKTAYASKIMPGGKMLNEVGLDKKKATTFLDGFVADVLTGNWDSVGKTMDNAMAFPDGRIARIDNGGTFLFRAKEGKKTEAVLNTITEWDRFFDPYGNKSYSRLASVAGVTKADDMKAPIRAGVAQVRALREKNGGWANYVKRVAPGLAPDNLAKITVMLERRMELLEAKVKEWDIVPVPAAPHKPGAARYVATQGSTTKPKKGLKLEDLPEVSLEPWLNHQKKHDALGEMPSGDSYRSYQKRCEASMAKAAPDERRAITEFTDGSYSIRKSEKEGRPNKSSEAITRAMDKCDREPGTVWRGLHVEEYKVGSKEKLQAQLDGYLNSEEFSLGGGCTSSSTWKLEIARDNFMGGTHDPSAGGSYSSGGLKVLFKLNTKTGIAIQSISSHSHEMEVLISRKARFRTTGLSRMAGKNRIIIIEAEEI